VTPEGRVPWACVLFDLDGTLADTVELILRCFRHTMRVHGNVEARDADWLATMGIPLRDQLARFARDGAEVDAMVETYSTFQRRVHDDLVAPFPGATEVLTRIRQGGARVGIVTSKRRAMAVRTLARCGLGELYDVLVGGDDVSRAKPDPEPVVVALDRLGLAGDVGRTLFVGDSPFDVSSGRAAGTRTAAALWGPFNRERLERERPDYYVRRLQEVLELRIPDAG
jgi:pyrophosphatase PpaX